MESFAFIVHPLEFADMLRKYRLLRFMPEGLGEFMLKQLPPFRLAVTEPITSAYGSVQGVFYVCPLTAGQMLAEPERAMMKIIKTAQLAEREGAKLIGLGAFTSIVGDAGISVAKAVNVPVTTGNTYTTAIALASLEKASSLLGRCLSESNVLVLGASGSIGAACAWYLASEVHELTLAARRKEPLYDLADRIYEASGAASLVSSNIEAAVKRADVIVAVTSSTQEIIQPEWLKKGAIVCDVARPRNISHSLGGKRNDVLIYDGGLVKMPCDAGLGFDFGLPHGLTYACMAETMLLALEKNYVSFTLGRDISLANIHKINKIAARHGFALAELRSFEKTLPQEKISALLPKRDIICNENHVTS